MRILLLVFAIITGCIGFANGQQDKGDNKGYWVYFKDKGPEAASMLSSYRNFLPEAMIKSHLQRGLPINETDLPVSKTYTRQLQAAGFTITGSSRWLNSVSVMAANLTLAKAKTICPAIVDVRPMLRVVMMYNSNADSAQPEYKSMQVDTLLNYGHSTTQDTMINIQCLHNRGYTGSGIKIAILDDGFIGIDSCKVFGYLDSTGHIKARYNVIDSSENLNVGEGHGTAVSSIISANLPGTMIGTAFDADLYLVVAGSAKSSFIEQQFINAVEWADDSGVDVIQSSLGYAYLPGIDTTGLNGYVYDSLNGRSPITRTAETAVSKGIIFVNALGNVEGSYTKLFAPADGDSVLAVGGVNSNGQYRTESSSGPTADGRIKPDVAAQAGNDASSGYGPSCLVTTIYSGTSFSAPLISGLAACLKQAHQYATGWQIVQAIEQSGRQYPLKDTLIGYGIPDACKADSLLSTIASINSPSIENSLKVYPVPAFNLVNVTGNLGNCNIQVWDELGHIVKVNLSVLDNEHVTLDLKDVAPGIYLLRLTRQNEVMQTARFIKFN